MIHQTIALTCEYCQKPFTANRTTARYCSGTCKTYASQERTGRKKPFGVHGIAEVENPIDRQARMAQLEISLRKLPLVRQRIKREFEALGKKISSLRSEARKFGLDSKDAQYPHGQIEAAKGQMDDFKLHFDRLLFEETRLKQEHFDLLLPRIWNDGKVSGKDIALFAEKRVRYPFEQMESNVNLRALGRPTRPFICYVCESDAEFDNFTEVVMDMAGEIGRCTESPILIIIDRQIMAKNFETLLEKSGLARESVTLVFAENRADIEAAFELADFEFAVFPDLSIFNLDYEFLLLLTKKHPRTSIFCASEKPKKDFLQRNRLNVRLQTGWDNSGWGGILVTPHSDFVFVP